MSMTVQGDLRCPTTPKSKDAGQVRMNWEPAGEVQRGGYTSSSLIDLHDNETLPSAIPKP
jgi:hypothetical protein